MREIVAFFFYPAVMLVMAIGLGMLAFSCFRELFGMMRGQR